jgi:DNA polymerase (family 10)
MALTNREIADLFDRVADMLQIKGEIIHRILAYRNAAESIRQQPRDLRAIAAEGGLEAIPSVGKIIAEKIQEMLDTGKLNFYEKLAEEVPPGVVDILHINGVGPKKAKQFWEAGIVTIVALETAAREGKLRDMAGMGAKSEAKILEGIESLKRRAANTRAPLGIALPAAELILARLLTLPGALKGVYAGSLRRARPTIGDIDLLIATEDSAPIMAAFVGMDTVARVLGHGDKKSSIELQNGVQVDLRAISPARWGTALQYFTGSQAHNIHIREIALARGYSLNEHALTPLDGSPEVLCDTEEAVYEHIGLPWIPPELREDWGEIESASVRTIPTLIQLDDICADLHMHTTSSDGVLSAHQMAEQALARGRRLIVITDHSQSSVIAGGLSPERLIAQRDEIRAVDAEFAPRGLRVLHGVECDIRADGAMDYDDALLASLDFVIASLHVGLRQPREQVTGRVLNALRNPHVDLIGHPRGQLISSRDAADLDMDAVFAAAQASGTALEINANPERLDLEAQYARRAAELGIPIAIDTDAHSAADMDNMRYGVMTARRGWVSAPAVLNTWTPERLIAWMQKRGQTP